MLPGRPWAIPSTEIPCSSASSPLSTSCRRPFLPPILPAVFSPVLTDARVRACALLTQGSAHCFHKGPDSKRLRLCGQTGPWLCPCSTGAPQSRADGWAGLAWAWLLTLLLTLVEASSPLPPERPVKTTLSCGGSGGHCPALHTPITPAGTSMASRRPSSPGFLLATRPLWQRGSVVTGACAALPGAGSHCGVHKNKQQAAEEA